MTTYQQYYLESLYPFQNEIIQIVNGRTDQFYLTGGTALSRGYLNHRYSDDLDFFTNNNPAFHKSCMAALEALSEAGFDIKFEKNISSSFVREVIFSKNKNNPVSIQVDFVNDVEAHFGDVVNHPVLGRLDSLRNILSNKLCTVLSRSEAKDIADLWAICKRYEFSWDDVLAEASKKDGSIDSEIITSFLQSLAENKFNEIHWSSKPPAFADFMRDIDIVAKDMDGLNMNSLFQKKDLSRNRQKSR